MPDLLQSGAQWLASQMKHHAAQDVTYVRGVATVDLRATRGQSKLDLADGDGGSYQILADDWLVAAEDLVLSGDVVTPKSGDRIQLETNTTRFTYEVISPTHEPMENGVRLRIHTKLVKTEAL